MCETGYLFGSKQHSAEGPCGHQDTLDYLGFDAISPLLAAYRTSPLPVAHISSLAAETYRQGLSVLMDALGLTQ